MLAHSNNVTPFDGGCTWPPGACAGRRGARRNASAVSAGGDGEEIGCEALSLSGKTEGLMIRAAIFMQYAGLFAHVGGDEFAPEGGAEQCAQYLNSS